MTTQEFLTKNYSNNNGKIKRFASVMMDDGNAYSYGYHYPLAFKFKSFNFINVAGYSNSTSKHIGWMRGALRARGIDATEVVLDRDAVQSINHALTHGTHEVEALQKIVAIGQRNLDNTRKQMASKKRKDTQVYASLEQDASKWQEMIDTVELIIRSIR